MDNVYSESTDISSVTSGESSVTEGYAGETETDNVVPDGADATESEAKKTFNTGRITAFAEWVVSLDNNPESLRAADANANISSESDSENLNVAAATGKLTDLAKSEGPDEINADYSRNNIPFPSSESLSTSGITYKDNGKTIYLNHWDANRRTRLKYDVYSIHSFTRKSDGKGRDYFLIRASGTTNTTKQFFKVKNEIVPSSTFGNNDAHALWGFTRRLKFNNYIEEDTGKNSEIAICWSIPDKKSASQTLSETSGYSFGGKVALAANLTKGDITATAEFNFTINHSTTVSNTAVDFEIVRSHYGDSSGRANASWEYIFSWPKLGKEIGSWSTNASYCYRELEEWPSSKEHTSQMEWIWEVKPDVWERVKNNKLTVYTNVEWVDGFNQGPYHRRLGTYWGDEYKNEFHKANSTHKFTIKRPPHIAVRPMLFSPSSGSKSFNKDAGNATFVVLSESDWSVKSNVDWLKDFTPSSGKATGAEEAAVAFSYTANTTGKPRAGVITLTNTEGDSVQIQVNQGAN